jgi:hypothetical protein
MAKAVTRETRLPTRKRHFLGRFVRSEQQFRMGSRFDHPEQGSGKADGGQADPVSTSGGDAT